MIDGLERCKIIALGSVGVDSVDVEAATQKGIPVTNCPDTFIDEVADHAMTLILATFRRLIVQDKLVRDGRWSEGRPMLSTIPRLMGQTLGLVSFGHVARAVARRAKAFGLHVIAYDPFIEELVAIEHGVEPGRGRGNMRGQNNIIHPQQRVVVAGRLLFEHVEPGGGDHPLVERLDQGGFVGRRAASGADVDRRLLHLAEVFLADQSVSAFGGRRMHRDDVGALQ